MTRRTALIVAVPEAEALVGDLRMQFDGSAPLGVPAHITILYPFAPPPEVDEAALAALFAESDAFDFELAAVKWFDDEVTYLAPVPADRFAALTRAVAERWPAYPPYEGAHETVIPHLTVAERRLDLELPEPIRARADAVTLIEQNTSGHWVSRARFALRSGERARRDS